MSKVTGLDTRNLPAYSYTDAEKYLHIPRGTIRSWVKGRTYQTQHGQRFSQPLIELSSPEAKALSFTNLVEAHVLRAIRVEHQVGLPQIRIALNFISRELGYPHPLVREDFLSTDGQSIYVEHLEQLLDASREGQIAIRETLEIYLTRIEVDEHGVAARLYPFVHPERSQDEPKVIVIDPRISFGRPTIVGTRIPTKVLADRHQAGDSIELLAEDYSCDRTLLQQALEYDGLAA